jgi:hypothetical protein
MPHTTIRGGAKADTEQEEMVPVSVARMSYVDTLLHHAVRGLWYVDEMETVEMFYWGRQSRSTRSSHAPMGPIFHVIVERFNHVVVLSFTRVTNGFDELWFRWISCCS